MKIISAIKKKGFRFALRRFDKQYGIGALEKLISINWFNPFLTIYVCFRSFPLKQAVYLPLFVYGRPRIYGLSGQMHVEGKVSTGMIRFNISRPGAPSVGTLQSEIINHGLIIYRGFCEIRTGCRIRVGEEGTIDFGNNIILADLCNIGCYSRINVGNTTLIAHRSQIFDSNYHYLANFEQHIVSQITKPIVIGNNCWICNSSSISKGTILPDFTIVASHSMVGKDFSDLEKGSIIGGVPAKPIARNIYRVENKLFTRKLYKFFQDTEEPVYQIKQDMRIEDIL